MTYRTDIEYRNGKMAVRSNSSGADTSMPLPKVQLTDRLVSDNWGASFENALKPFGLDSDPALQGAIRAQKSVVSGVKRLMFIRDNQDPGDRQSAHLEKLARDYGTFQKNYLTEFERARSTVKTRLNDTVRAFEEHLKFDLKDAPAIQATLRSMNDEERGKAIAHEVETGDGRGLAAILNAHPLASGISHEQQAAYRIHAMQKHRPDLLALERELKRADKLLFDTFNDVLSIEHDLTAKAVRDQYADQARLAAEARKAFASE